MVAFKTFNTCKCIRPSDRSGRILENCDSAVHKIGKGTGARHRKQGPWRLFLRGSVFGLTASLGLPTLTERLLCRIKIPHPRAKLRQICHMQIKLPTESCVCEVGTVSKISDVQPEGSGFNTPPGRGLNFRRPSFATPSVDRNVKPLV